MKNEKIQFARQIWKNMLIYVEECKITRKKMPIYEKKEDKFILKKWHIYK